MKTFLFPGQGSQARGMGAELFDEYREIVDEADSILGYSIKDLCLNDVNKELSKTQFTQPAIYVVSALSFFKKMDQSGVTADFYAGHSLGEFNALLAAECFDFSVGLQLVKKRGELMAGASLGGMAAILNASQQEIESVLLDNGLDEIDIANHNSPSQIVVSGAKEQIIKAEKYFQKGKMQYIPLNAGGAIHSRFMRPSRDDFEKYLKGFTFRPLKRPVISNFSARPYLDGEVIENLSSQITGSVRWAESIQYLMEQGASSSSSETMEFEEIGHGDVLAKLVRSIQRYMPKPEQSQTPKPANAREKVSLWNKEYPIGTKVKSSVVDESDLETRTEAVVLFQCRPAVYLKGYQGYFDLEEITPT